jgi:homoserine dehydrogenase
MKISLIGAGNIGSQFYRHATEKGWQVPVVAEITGVYDGAKVGNFVKLYDYLQKNGVKIGDDYLKNIAGSDVAALTIPTSDNGEAAFKMIKNIDELGIPVVTSEKGALSHRFADLEKMIDSGHLGFSASVGGGTRMLRFLESMAVEGDVQEVHAIVNATINNIISKCEKSSLDSAIRNSIELGIAEPGSTSALGIVNTEANKDIPRKAVILFNMLMKHLGKRDYISFRDIKTEPITEDRLKGVLKMARNTRYIVSIKKDCKEGDVPLGGFSIERNGWMLSGGFRDIRDNKLYERIWVDDENNAIVVSKGEKGVYSLSGPGARPKPTVDSMIFDVVEMTKKGIIGV